MSTDCSISDEYGSNNNSNYGSRFPIKGPFATSNFYITRKGSVYVHCLTNYSQTAVNQWKILTVSEDEVSHRSYVLHPVSGLRMYIDELLLHTFGCKTQRRRYSIFKAPVIRHRDSHNYNNNLRNLEWVEDTPEVVESLAVNHRQRVERVNQFIHYLQNRKYRNDFVTKEAILERIRNRIHFPRTVSDKEYRERRHKTRLYQKDFHLADY